MRSNTKILASFLISMMLVSFYGNLGIKIAPLNRTQPPRQLFISIILKVFRNIFVSIFKFILGIVAMVVGFVWAVFWGFLSLMFCDRKEIRNNQCFSRLMFEAGVITMVFGAVEIADIGRTLNSNDDLGKMSWFGVSKKNNNRSLSKGLDDDTPAEEPLDCDKYPRKAPYEVLQDVLAEAFDTNVKLVRMTSRIKDIDLFLRQGYIAEPNSVLDKNTRKTLDTESGDKQSQMIVGKAKLFRSRIRRSVCAAMWSFTNLLDIEITPEKWTGDKKTKYDKLKKESETATNQRKNEIQQEIKKMVGFDPEKEESKTKMSEMMNKEFEKYNVSKHDLSSQYTANVIKEIMEKYRKSKMAGVEQTVPELTQGNEKYDEAKANLVKVDTIKLPDDSRLVISDIQEDENEENLEQGEGIKHS